MIKLHKILIYFLTPPSILFNILEEHPMLGNSDRLS